MVDHTLKVATVAACRVAAINLLGGIRRRVVRRIAIGKAVRHNKIDHIGSSEALTLARALTACTNGIGHLVATLAAAEAQLVLHRLGIATYGHIHKDIVGALGLMYLRNLNAHTLWFDCHIVGRDVIAIYHKLKRRCHTNPPRERLDMANFEFRLCRHCAICEYSNGKYRTQ